MSLDEAARQLRMAGHDAQVAFDCIGIGELERAQEHAITARAAADAAETALRAAMADLTAEQAQQAGDRAIAELKDE
ncbi:MAG TPA: hypothetical protein VF069_16365 [Streptosporangiaceae bacterium]